VLFVARNGDSPVESRTGDRKVRQATFHKPYYFVEARTWCTEFRVVLVVLQQLVLVLRQAEEVRLFFSPNNFGIGFSGIADAIFTNFGLSLGVKRFIAYGVPASVL